MFLREQFDRFKNNFWLLWFGILAIIFLIQLKTLTISPTVWMDEVQIVDYGRTIFEPQSDWSINWSLELNRPVIALNYLGNYAQNLAYKITQSPLGPRLFSLIGGLITATACLGWLLSLKNPRWLAFCLSLILLLDPIFVSSYRGARVDSWAMGLCLITCWIIRNNTNNSLETNNFQKQLFFFVGVSITIIPFIWPTALLLVPLIFLKLIENLLQTKNFNTPKIINLLLILFSGVLVTFIILIIPIWSQIILAVGDLFKFAKADSLALNISDKISSDLRLFKVALAISPFLLIGSVLISFLIKEKKLTYTFLFVLTLVMVSRPYGNRIVYLIPYFILILSYFLNNQKAQLNNKYLKFLKISFLLTLLIWSLSMSLGYRTVIALSQQEGRNFKRLENDVVSIIKKEDKVLIPYEYYYTGRNLEWKIFNVFGNYTPEQWKNFIVNIDYVIIPFNSSPRITEELDKAGFYLIKNLNDPVPQEQNKLFFGGRPFNSYKLYKRTN